MRREPSLWRDPDFLKLWCGQAISEIGTRVSREGIPWTALAVLHATPAQMGWLAALGGIAALVGGPAAGSLADRCKRKPLMIAADLGRAMILVIVPIAAFGGWLTLAQLSTVVFLVGLLNVLFLVAYPTYVPGLVGRDRLLAANSRLMLTGSVAEVSGPGITGVLVQTLGAPRAILVDAVSFLISAVSIAWIRKPETQPERAASEGTWRDAVAGFQYVRRHPILRPLALRTGTAFFCFGTFMALYLLYASRDLQMNALTLGVIIALGGAGSLIGALLAERIGSRWRPGVILFAATVWVGFWNLLNGLAPSPGVVAILCLGAAQLLGDIGYPIYNIHELTLRQRVTDPGMLGRVNASMQMILQGAWPVGAIIGGLLGEIVGARVAMLVSASGAMLSSLWLLRSDIWKLQFDTIEEKVLL